MSLVAYQQIPTTQMLTQHIQQRNSYKGQDGNGNGKSIEYEVCCEKCLGYTKDVRSSTQHNAWENGYSD